MLTPQNSVPFPKNPTIAQLFTQMGRSEELGTGIRKVFKYSKAYSGSDKVSFSEEDVFVTRVPLDDLIDSNKLELNVNLVDTVQKSVEKGVEKSVEKIIALLYQNPYITQIEISKMTNLTRRGVEKNIAKLKSSGIIERIGPDKGGYWKVTLNNN